MLQLRLPKMKDLYHKYPRIFWILVVITFIDRIGGALLFPFFALYLTSKFGVGMTDVGVLFATFVPEDMRGRYMAVFGFFWGIPFAVGLYLAGLIVDGPSPQYLWYAAGFIGLLSTIGFLGLHRMRNRDARSVAAFQESA